jgi:DNA polymerase I-like protein with 3'-5' exonuclease and polymerase domains
VVLVVLDKYVQAVCPGFDCEALGRYVKESNNPEQVWRIFGDTLYVPPVAVFRYNILLVDKFAEVVNAFAKMEILPSPDDWSTDVLDVKNISDDMAAVVQLQWWIDNLRGKVLACDIETSKIAYDGNKLLAIGFSEDYYTAVSITNFSPMVLAKLQELFDREDITFVWHNGKFDTSRLKYIAGLRARVDEDTMLLHYVGINEKKGTHGLKQLGSLYLQAPDWDAELNAYKKEWCRVHRVKLDDFTYDLIPLNTLIPYLHRDCIATFRLLKLFQKLARPESDFIYRKLIKASNVYREIELAGVQLDIPYLSKLDAELSAKLAEAEDEIEQIATRYWVPSTYMIESGAKSSAPVFNPGSPKQLKWMLERLTGMRVESTDVKTIEKLLTQVGESGEAYRLLKALSTSRKMNKYLKTYARGIQGIACVDNRVRCSYNLHGTETGRLSSTEPNMQNIPRNKDIKNIFTAKEGYKLVQLDYSQAELRVLAALSGDPFLLKVYLDGKDLHDSVAIEMFGPDFTKEQRVICKSLNFGIVYGRGPGSIAEMFKLSIQQAKKFIDDWYRPMPLVKQFISERRAEPLKGLPCKTIFGRQRTFIITADRINGIQNESINTPIQSIASDCTLFSVIELHEWLQSSGLDAKIIISVHDSIVLEVLDDPATIDAVVTMGKEIMRTVPPRHIPDIKVPFKADAEVGQSWGDLEKWVGEFEEEDEE